MCLCGTLICLYVTFITMSAVDRRHRFIEVSSAGCGVIAGFLHFAILSSLSWMAVEGYNMLLMLVLVLNSYVPRFMYKAAVFAWGA